uniref:Uncharacterized protein n=2 Tax=Corethron hystrix TaxID=216773 RepID=A0A7S1BGU3_9STRA|mmetsp:Transcript_27329/g.62719  ORF Transcript_27329/g.62719 Transcript_27329/m.62719 type:complete len:1258 (+) Transcript_27329:856-4629(+)
MVGKHDGSVGPVVSEEYFLERFDLNRSYDSEGNLCLMDAIDLTPLTSSRSYDAVTHREAARLQVDDEPFDRTDCNSTAISRSVSSSGFSFENSFGSEELSEHRYCDQITLESPKSGEFYESSPYSHENYAHVATSTFSVPGMEESQPSEVKSFEGFENEQVFHESLILDLKQKKSQTCSVHCHIATSFDAKKDESFKDSEDEPKQEIDSNFALVGNLNHDTDTKLKILGKNINNVSLSRGETAVAPGIDNQNNLLKDCTDSNDQSDGPSLGITAFDNDNDVKNELDRLSEDFSDCEIWSSNNFSKLNETGGTHGEKRSENDTISSSSTTYFSLPTNIGNKLCDELNTSVMDTMVIPFDSFEEGNQHENTHTDEATVRFLESFQAFNPFERQYLPESAPPASFEDLFFQPSKDDEQNKCIPSSELFKGNCGADGLDCDKLLFKQGNKDQVLRPLEECRIDKQLAQLDLDETECYHFESDDVPLDISVNDDCANKKDSIILECTGQGAVHIGDLQKKISDDDSNGPVYIFLGDDSDCECEKSVNSIVPPLEVNLLSNECEKQDALDSDIMEQADIVESTVEEVKIKKEIDIVMVESMTEQLSTKKELVVFPPTNEEGKLFPDSTESTRYKTYGISPTLEKNVESSLDLNKKNYEKNKKGGLSLQSFQKACENTCSNEDYIKFNSNSETKYEYDESEHISQNCEYKSSSSIEGDEKCQNNVEEMPQILSQTFLDPLSPEKMGIMEKGSHSIITTSPPPSPLQCDSSSTTSQPKPPRVPLKHKNSMPVSVPPYLPTLPQNIMHLVLPPPPPPPRHLKKKRDEKYVVSNEPLPSKTTDGLDLPVNNGLDAGDLSSNSSESDTTDSDEHSTSSSTHSSIVHGKNELPIKFQNLTKTFVENSMIYPVEKFSSATEDVLYKTDHSNLDHHNKKEFKIGMTGTDGQLEISLVKEIGQSEIEIVVHESFDQNSENTNLVQITCSELTSNISESTDKDNDDSSANNVPRNTIGTMYISGSDSEDSSEPEIPVDWNLMHNKYKHVLNTGMTSAPCIPGEEIVEEIILEDNVETHLPLSLPPAYNVNHEVTDQSKSGNYMHVKNLNESSIDSQNSQIESLDNLSRKGQSNIFHGNDSSVCVISCFDDGKYLNALASAENEEFFSSSQELYSSLSDSSKTVDSLMISTAVEAIDMVLHRSKNVAQSPKHESTFEIPIAVSDIGISLSDSLSSDIASTEGSVDSSTLAALGALIDNMQKVEVGANSHVFTKG